MSELEKVLQSAIQTAQAVQLLHESLQSELSKATARNEVITQREVAVAARESKVRLVEDINNVQNAVKASRDEIGRDTINLTNAKVAFENLRRQELQKIQSLNEELVPLQELMAQTRKDREALEVEKKNYKDLLRTEFVKKLGV